MDLSLPVVQLYKSAQSLKVNNLKHFFCYIIDYSITIETHNLSSNKYRTYLINTISFNRYGRNMLLSYLNSLDYFL